MRSPLSLNEIKLRLNKDYSSLDTPFYLNNDDDENFNTLILRPTRELRKVMSLNPSSNLISTNK
jgi:hypothetical protein